MCISVQRCGGADPLVRSDNHVVADQVILTLHFRQDSVTITLPKSKTVPFSKGVPITMSATGDSICPRGPLKKLIARFKAPVDAPLFIKEYLTPLALAI
jgi:hypothetical protein